MTKEKPTIKEYILFRESFVQSLLSDVSTFGTLMFSFWFNKNYIGSSLINIVILIIIVVTALGRTMGKSKRFSDKKKLKEYVNNL